MEAKKIAQKDTSALTCKVLSKLLLSLSDREKLGAIAIIQASEGYTLKEVAKEQGRSLLEVRQCFGRVREESGLCISGLRYLRRHRQEIRPFIILWCRYKREVNALEEKYIKHVSAEHAGITRKYRN